MREKLIELIGRTPCCGFSSVAAVESIADHLIANGVTVTDNNVGGKWISVKERLPAEHDSLFTSFYGTAKWQEGMFLKYSDTVLASVEYEDGKRRVKAIITKDGKWDIHNLYEGWLPKSGRNRRKRAHDKGW